MFGEGSFADVEKESSGPANDMFGEDAFGDAAFGNNSAELANDMFGEGSFIDNKAAEKESSGPANDVFGEDAFDDAAFGRDSAEPANDTFGEGSITDNKAAEKDSAGPANDMFGEGSPADKAVEIESSGPVNENLGDGSFEEAGFGKDSSEPDERSFLSGEDGDSSSEGDTSRGGDSRSDQSGDSRSQSDQSGDSRSQSDESGDSRSQSDQSGDSRSYRSEDSKREGDSRRSKDSKREIDKDLSEPANGMFGGGSFADKSVEEESSRPPNDIFGEGPFEDNAFGTDSSEPVKENEGFTDDSFGRGASDPADDDPDEEQSDSAGDEAKKEVFHPADDAFGKESFVEDSFGKDSSEPANDMLGEESFADKVVEQELSGPANDMFGEGSFSDNSLSAAGSRSRHSLERSGSISRHSSVQSGSKSSRSSFADGSARSGSRSRHSSERSGSISRRSSVQSGSKSSRSSFADGSSRSGSRSRHSSERSGSRSSGSPRSRNSSVHSGSKTQPKASKSAAKKPDEQTMEPEHDSEDSESEKSIMLGEVFGRPNELFVNGSVRSGSRSRHSTERSGSRSPGSPRSRRPPRSHNSSVHSGSKTQPKASKSAAKKPDEQTMEPEHDSESEQSIMLGEVFGRPNAEFDTKGRDERSENSQSQEESSQNSQQSSLQSAPESSAPAPGAEQTPTGHSKAASMSSDILSAHEDRAHEESEAGNMAGEQSSDQSTLKIERVETIKSPAGVNVARDALGVSQTTKSAKSDGEVEKQKKKRGKKKKKRRIKTIRSDALLDLVANINEAMLALEEGQHSEESKEKNMDSSAHSLLHGFEALLGILLQLSDELELISTFAKAKKKKDADPIVPVHALKAVLSFAETLDQLFAQLRPIIEDCFEEEPDEEMDDMLYRLNSLVDLLCETTHRVGEKQEWNERVETTYVTLLELMERETLELSCYFDDVDTPEYELSANIHEAWSATGHIEELRALQYASDPWLFRQVCYEVMVSTDQWCPDTTMLMEICGIDPSMLEEEPDQDILDEDELAPIPQAAEHVLDKVNGDPLPRSVTLASILRRILPPRAMTDPTLLDNFTSIRNTLRNPLGLSATNIVSISSIPEVLNDPDALGVGGMGKTTLAAMVATHHDVRRYFIDGVVWVYVGDKELNYSRYTQCLRELVAQLDFYQGVPLFAELLHTPGETLSKRRRREEGFMIYARDTIAELLHDRSVLIILDDVCFEPDLDWFDFAPMPGEEADQDATCALLVTTRCRTLLPAADTVEIDMLDEADAISLLIQESGQLSHSLMAESREARSVVRECANHPLAVKSVGRWLNLKHATAGVVSSVEEIHAEVIKSMDKILKGGDHSGTDMMYEILSMSLSPAINGEPTSIIKFCLAAFVVVFCDREYISDFALTEPTPIIPMDMAELLFETLLELNESSLLQEGSLFYAQKKEAAVLIPEALSALGVLKVITYSDAEDDEENPEDEQKFLQVMHFIHQEYGECLRKEDEALKELTKDAERQWNRALVDAYLGEVEEWDMDLDDARHSYALEMIISHMIRGGMFKEAGELLADKGFVRGRLLSLGRENSTRRHVKDCEMLFKKLRERRSKGQAKLEPRVVVKQAYQALGGLLAMDEDDISVEGARIRDVEVARAHYEIGFSLAEKRCWDAAIAHWETSQELLVSALGTVEVVAGILYNIGVVYSEMNEYEKALDSLKKCLRIRGTIHGEEHILYAQTIQKIGDIFLGMSDYHEAMESYNWALDVMYSEPSHHRVDIGEILDNKGSIHYSKGEIEEALQCHQDALRSKQVDLGEDHPELSGTYHHIGNCLSDQGNIEDAIVHFEEAIRLKELDQEGGPERDADVLTIEGVLHNLEGNQEQGLECYEKSLQILVTKVPHRKEKVASLLHLIGCVYLMSGEQKKAMKLFEESLQARRKVLGFVHLDVASTLFNMAFLHQTRNRLDKALKCLEEALKIRQLRLPDSEKVAVTHEKIGTLARAIGKTKKAEIAFEEALRIRKIIHGEQHEAVATVLQELGDLMDDLGEYDYAMNYYIDALDIRRNRLGPDDVAVAETLYSMGFTLHNNDASDRALVCFEESLSIRRFQLGEDSKEVGDTLNMMGFLKAKKGELDDALTYLWDALRIRKLQEDHVKVSETLKNIGNVHREKQEQTLAVECYEECLRIRRSELGPDHEKVADALIAMGNVQSDMDRTDEAMRSYQEALKIRTMVYGEHDESVAAVLQYMGTMEFRAGNHEKARDLLTEFIRIRRDNNTKNDGDYVNVLFMIGNIHKIQGNEEDAQVCWSEAYQVFQELGLAEGNPQIAKVMNHLLKAELGNQEEEDKKKKKLGAGLFGKVTEKVKETLREEKLAVGNQKKKTRARKGKGYQL
jgi:tetratricopeptide (TPR) repeat protein